MRRLTLILMAAAGAAALPAPGLCDGAPDLFLLGAPFARSDLRPLAPGLTTLRFQPGHGLVRHEPASQTPPPGAPGFAAGPSSVAITIPLALERRRGKSARWRLRDGRAFGAQPRWFLFAAARGRALGYSFLGDSEHGTGGLALERGGFFGEAQVGLGWRRKSTQVSLSFVQQEIDVRLFDVEDVEEHRAALTFTRFLGDPKNPSGRLFQGKSIMTPPSE